MKMIGGLTAKAVMMLHMKYKMTDFILGFIIGWFFDDIVALCKKVYEEAKIAKRDWRKK